MTADPEIIITSVKALIASSAQGVINQVLRFMTSRPILRITGFFEVSFGEMRRKENTWKTMENLLIHLFTWPYLI